MAPTGRMVAAEALPVTLSLPIQPVPVPLLLAIMMLCEVVWVLDPIRILIQFSVTTPIFTSQTGTAFFSEVEAVEAMLSMILQVCNQAEPGDLVEE